MTLKEAIEIIDCILLNTKNLETDEQQAFNYIITQARRAEELEKRLCKAREISVIFKGNAQEDGFIVDFDKCTISHKSTSVYVPKYDEVCEVNNKEEELILTGSITGNPDGSLTFSENACKGSVPFQKHLEITNKLSQQITKYRLALENVAEYPNYNWGVVARKALEE